MLTFFKNLINWFFSVTQHFVVEGDLGNQTDVSSLEEMSKETFWWKKVKDWQFKTSHGLAKKQKTQDYVIVGKNPSHR
jgi:hypothetical protein